MKVEKTFCDKCKKEIVPPEADSQIQVITFSQTKTFDYCSDCVEKVFGMRAR